MKVGYIDSQTTARCDLSDPAPSTREQMVIRLLKTTRHEGFNPAVRGRHSALSALRASARRCGYRAGSPVKTKRNPD
jgi:hypothetical protein